MPINDPVKRRKYYRIYHKEWRAKNKDKIIRRNNAWKKENPQKVRDQMARWREKHREEIRKYYRKWKKKQKLNLKLKDKNATRK